MSEYKRLTTETPTGNYQYLHNATKIKDRQVYLRDFNGGGDLSIIDYCKKECQEKCKADFSENANPEEFGEYMDCDCPISLLYGMAVGHAELRARLATYEDSGLSPEDVSGALRRLKKAEAALRKMAELYPDLGLWGYSSAAYDAGKEGDREND